MRKRKAKQKNQLLVKEPRPSVLVTCVPQDMDKFIMLLDAVGITESVVLYQIEATDSSPALIHMFYSCRVNIFDELASLKVLYVEDEKQLETGRYLILRIDSADEDLKILSTTKDDFDVTYEQIQALPEISAQKLIDILALHFTAMSLEEEGDKIHFLGSEHLISLGRRLLKKVKLFNSRKKKHENYKQRWKNLFIEGGGIE